MGKLVVMLQSKDAKPFTAAEGDNVAVGTGTGIVSNYDRKDGLQLNYKDATGNQVMIQAPLSLHWTDAQLGRVRRRGPRQPDRSSRRRLIPPPPRSPPSWGRP